MKVRERRLYSRNSYFYYRYILSRNLRLIFPNKEIKILLNTQDVALARLYVAKLDIEVHSLIADIETAQSAMRLGIESMDR